MGHIHEKIDYTVEVMIVHRDKILLRLHDKYGIWLSVGGHIELDENPNQAALREVKEEVGLNVELYSGNKTFEKDTDKFHELIPPMHMNYHQINDTHWHVTMTYYAIADSDQIIPEDPEDKWEWLTLDKLRAKADVSAEVLHYAESALKITSF